MKKFEYVIKDEMGIHARIVCTLVDEARKYKSKIMIFAKGKSSEATNLMGVMGMSVECGQTVNVEITGTDEETAYDSMKKFFEENL